MENGFGGMKKVRKMENGSKQILVIKISSKQVSIHTGIPTENLNQKDILLTEKKMASG